MNTRRPGVDIARGAAVLLVVPFHASGELPSSAWIDSFHTVAGGVRMPLLMFICGLLTSRSYRTFERVVQFGWLFVIWSTITLVSLGFVKGIAPTPTSIVSQLVYPTTGLWFVWAVAGMTVSLPFLKNSPLLTLTIAASISMLNDAVQPFGGGSFAYNQTVSHAIFFYFGAFYGWRLIEWVEGRGHSVLWLVPLLAALRLFDHLTVESLGWQVLGLAERVTAICLALHLASQVHRVPVIGSKLVEIGQNTLPLYVGHGIFLSVGVLLFSDLVPASLAVALVTAFALAGSVALHRASLVFDAPWLYKVPDGIAVFLRNPWKDRSRTSQKISSGQPTSSSSINAEPE